MNRKNTILIAVLINAGLLAVLFVAAITMQEELVVETNLAKEEPIELQLPKFDEVPAYQEFASLTPAPPPRPVEELVYKLPQLDVPPPAEVVAKPAVTPPQAIHEVVVKKGDTLEKIARSQQTTVDAIIKLNHLPSTALKIGQTIKIPEGRAVPKPPEKKPAEVSLEYYTLKVGESPWAVAQRHHMKVEELLKLNGLNEEKARKLKPGDRLRIR